MAKSPDVFQRYEKKYLISQQQYEMLKESIFPRLGRDQFSVSTISNIYYDTPDFRLIRASLEKPAYKEKMRLRTYCVPGADTEAFVEIKKKVAGVVYKRRVGMTYGEARQYLAGKCEAPQQSQILREIDWFRSFYGSLEPAMVISYDRLALFDREDPSLRFTFDCNILWRRDTLSLSAGVWGEPLLAEGEHLLEIKIPGVVPLWVAHVLTDAGIYPTGFSKYGAAYERMLQKKDKGEIFCA